MAENNISAIVKDGKIQPSTASQMSISADKVRSASSLDKDAFLQLLVAQMKYQDPLEPTDNTEYISQLATFSELEEMQNMVSTTNFQRASMLVGSEVACKVTDSKTGGTDIISGVVDYVIYEGNKAYVSINESLYNVDDVYQVVDPEYSEAYKLAQKFCTAMASLPKVGNLTLEYAEPLKTLRDTYDAMNNYQKSFIAKDVVTLLESYEERMKELKAIAGIGTDADNNSNSNNKAE